MTEPPGRQSGSSIPQLEHTRLPSGVQFHTPTLAGVGGGGGALRMFMLIFPLIDIRPSGVFIITLNFDSLIESANIRAENE